MGTIIKNGIEYAGGDTSVRLTQAEYDALGDEKLTDGKVYYITDGVSSGVNDSLNVDFTNSTATSVNQLLQYVADKFFGKIMYLLQNGVVNTGLVSFIDTTYSLPDRTDYSHVPTITTYSDGFVVVKLSGTENLSTGSWFSDNAFDLTGKKYLHITFHNFVMTNGNWSCLYGVTPTKTNNYTLSSFSSIAPTNNETSVTLDISNVSGEQYIVICLGGGGNYASFKDIWLE